MSKKDNAPVSEMTMTRLFNAPVKLLWEVWTHPRHVAQWWGPQGFTNPVCEWDARTGGNIFINMVDASGNESPMYGEFLELVPGQKMVFRADKRNASGEKQFEVINTITFEPEGEKTKLTIHSSVTMATEAAKAFLGGMDEGWTASLDKLENFIADENNESKFHI